MTVGAHRAADRRQRLAATRARIWIVVGSAPGPLACQRVDYLCIFCFSGREPPHISRQADSPGLPTTTFTNCEIAQQVLEHCSRELISCVCDLLAAGFEQLGQCWAMIRSDSRSIGRPRQDLVRSWRPRPEAARVARNWPCSASFQSVPGSAFCREQSVENSENLSSSCFDLRRASRHVLCRLQDVARGASQMRHGVSRSPATVGRLSRIGRNKYDRIRPDSERIRQKFADFGHLWHGFGRIGPHPRQIGPMYGCWTPPPQTHSVFMRHTGVHRVRLTWCLSWCLTWCLMWCLGALCEASRGGLRCALRGAFSALVHTGPENRCTTNVPSKPLPASPPLSPSGGSNTGHM